MLVTLIICLVATVVTTGAFHFLTRSHLIAAAAEKAVYLKCSLCGLLVARYEQLKDSSIRCANCKRAAERKGA